jgi:diaminopropionate ammonia-lyase
MPVTPRTLLNPWLRPEDVPLPSDAAAAFHRSLPGYGLTPVRELPAEAARLGLAWVGVKDESARLGLPAFKVLGASWAVECALRERADVDTLVAASAGNHGRAVAHVAAMRGLRARIFLPHRSSPARRSAIESEGAEVVVVDGSYEQAVAQAAAAGGRPGAIEIADVGTTGPAHDVIDGYATLFAEAADQARFDLVLVPVGVGSLAAAAARFGAAQGMPVIGVEPVTAACLTASLAAGEPTAVHNPGTSMAGLDCAEISATAWPVLRDGIAGMLTVDDDETVAAMRDLAAAGLALGECGSAALAALRLLVSEADAGDLRAAAGLGPASRVLLIATEGVTDPDAYRRSVPGER